MNMPDNALLYWNTVKCLKPVQAWHQVKKRICGRRGNARLERLQRLEAPRVAGISILIPELDCDRRYLSRFSVGSLMEGRVTLLHETHRPGRGWQVADASHLWNYNLHYLEFLVPLAVEYAESADEAYFLKWKEFVQGWMGQQSADSLEPYTISVRVVSLLACMEILEKKIRGTPLEKTLLDSIYRQYRYLQENQELALLANHYFENLKAVVICSLLFGEADVYRRHFGRFLEQAGEQILPDGMHYERSFLYHRIILEDILRVYMALNSSGHACDAEKLLPAIRSMSLVLADVEQGFPGRTPLFNDAADNAGKDAGQLLAAVQRLCGFGGKPAERPFWHRKESGYCALSSGRIFLLLDCGDIGPSYMGGHAHCDCLSFEMSLDGRCLFANSGTGCYQGARRAFFRSTAAHNTVMIDGREQAQLWGEHRAGKRMAHISGSAGPGRLSGSFRSWRGDGFRRVIRLDGRSGRLTVEDSFRAHDRGVHAARQFFHLAPGLSYERHGQLVYILGRRAAAAGGAGKYPAAAIRIPEGSGARIYRSGPAADHAQEFGLYRKKQVLEIRTPFAGCVDVRIVIETGRGMEWTGRAR